MIVGVEEMYFIIYANLKGGILTLKILALELVKLYIVCYEYHLCSSKLMDVK